VRALRNSARQIVIPQPRTRCERPAVSRRKVENTQRCQLCRCTVKAARSSRISLRFGQGFGARNFASELSCNTAKLLIAVAYYESIKANVAWPQAGAQVTGRAPAAIRDGLVGLEPGLVGLEPP
jgi:hypothetical protein